MESEKLDCGHAPDPGLPYGSAGHLGWQFVRMDDGRRLCHACADARILDCGHRPSPHHPSTTGYGIDSETGGTACYACCADRDRARMLETGRADLYLARAESGAWRVTNWPGSLEFPAFNVRSSRHGGGFGSQRTDADFRGPDGHVWHAVNRGDMQLARCKRTKARAS